MHIANYHKKRQDITAVPTGITGVDGVDTLAPTATVGGGGLAVDTSALPNGAVSAPPIAGNGIPTVTSAPLSATPPNPSASNTGSTSSASNSSNISMGTVIGACVGAFAGLLLVLLLYVWFNKRHKQWKVQMAEALARSPTDARNAQSRMEQRRSRGRSWNVLHEKDQDKWEGMHGEQPKDMDEKQLGISNLFKKSPSMRTTRTTKTVSDEDQSYDLPPFEFAQYHPELAAQLALEQPEKPFAKRGDSGISWDGDTVADDTVRSLRSARVDSGTMSPTLAKLTPPTTSFTEHKWESAEVLHMEQDAEEQDATQIQNPFADVVDEQRKSVANPFFNAQDLPLAARSRSSSRVSRSYSRSINAHSRATSPGTSSPTSPVQNPFADAQEIPVTRVAVPAAAHSHNDSIASNSSGPYPARAMQTLIAALDIPQEDVEARLRVASISASSMSRTSFSNASSLYTLGDDESDIATVRNFPMPPSPPAAHHPS